MTSEQLANLATKGEKFILESVGDVEQILIDIQQHGAIIDVGGYIPENEAAHEDQMFPDLVIIAPSVEAMEAIKAIYVEEENA